MHPRWTSTPAAALALATLATALYAPRLGHPFVTDDAVYIVENPAVREGAPLAAYFADRATIASNPDLHWQAYRPLRTLAFRAIAALAGVNALAFGLANLALYVVSALLLFLLAVRLGTPRPAALAAAALWVAAPVHVEPVLYASSLGDHLSLALELGALVLVLRTLERPRPVLAVTAWLMVAAALLAKEMAVTAPALIALVAIAVGKWRGARLTVAAHAGAVLLFLAARTAVLGAFGHGALAAGGVLHALAVAPLRLAAYLRITLAPLGHSAAYVLATPSTALIAGAWVLTLLVGVALARAGRMARLGMAWFALALLPVLGLVPLLADLADRFALLPSVGLALAAPAAAAALGRAWRPLGVLAPALAFIAYVAGTAVERGAWASEAALWSKAVALEPRSAQAQRNLGLILLQGGQPAEALRHLDEARALGEMAGELDRRRAMALEALGRFAEAEGAARAALERDPTLGSAHALLGGLLARRGDLGGAASALKNAQRLEPRAPSTLLLAAEIATREGDFSRALVAHDALIARYPAEARFRYQRGLAFLAMGDAAAAASDARHCLTLAREQPQCACLLGRALVATAPLEARQALGAGLRQLVPGAERRACEEALRAVR
jgi:tetratricopeptide (TPR) repeat protein